MLFRFKVATKPHSPKNACKIVLKKFVPHPGCVQDKEKKWAENKLSLNILKLWALAMDLLTGIIYLNFLYLQMMALMNIQDRLRHETVPLVTIIFPLNQLKLYFSILTISDEIECHSIEVRVRINCQQWRSLKILWRSKFKLTFYVKSTRQHFSGCSLILAYSYHISVQRPP